MTEFLKLYGFKKKNWNFNSQPSRKHPTRRSYAWNKKQWFEFDFQFKVFFIFTRTNFLLINRVIFNLDCDQQNLKNIL